MNGRMLGRREFNRLCAALGVALPTVSTMILRPLFAQSVGTVVALNDVGRTVKFHDGTIVPALGQGSWHLAQGRHPEAAEEDALRTGLSERPSLYISAVSINVIPSGRKSCLGSELDNLPILPAMATAHPE